MNNKPICRDEALAKAENKSPKRKRRANTQTNRTKVASSILQNKHRRFYTSSLDIEDPAALTDSLFLFLISVY
jgi:hypothetical protein